MNRTPFWIAGFAIAAVMAPASADVLLNQPADLENRWTSYYSPSGRQFADDFRPDENVVVESVSCFMVSTWPNLPRTFSLGVYRRYFDHDLYPFAPFHEHFFRQFNPSSVTDLGPWPHDENLRLVEVRFDNLGLHLEAGAADMGIYWFACAGHLSNYPIDRCYWATANTNAPNGDEGFTKRHPIDWPGWALMIHLDIPASDFAMRIEGVPADEWQPTTELTSFNVAYGSHVEGELDDLREAGDEEVVTVLSRVSRRDGFRYNTMTFITRARSLVENPDVLDVSVSADIQRIFAIPEATLYFLNHRTGEWDEVGRHDLYDETDTWAFRNIPAADYLDENNEIELKFEVLGNPNGASRMTYSFEANIDRVRIDARQVH